ncbi:carbohydrate ABC transporter membrane protein 2, CUT1 family [Rathayibacter oskolensis]|uniref:Carbohydrate ABC transporter membrane protein 2, CUT1 family n=1 Tax=Rathayibacter oskolensis TaxID=1891671 RepID=A0A1X7PHI7_9MICO|nr:carbohydrate ABC transporter permease [Rathayibacter oskolensis]SMH50257.1 carbohydrate ABC transporter membrane protein 2, CUT1 family [Rathayibacter oskolensis]
MALATAPRATAPRKPASTRRRGSSVQPKKSIAFTLLMSVFILYSLVPLAWLVINSTKTQAGLLSSFGLWFDGDFVFFQNIAETLTYRDGIFLRWLGNTLLYVVVGAGGATLLATLAGYGLAKFRFAGRKAVFAVVLGAIAVPGTALAVPTFLMFSQLGLTNTPWAIIIPSLISPFGLYLVWVYAVESVPTELLEAARMDGAGEFRTFFTISIRLLAPGIVTVLLFSVVATWNNYFLPLIMLSDPAWYPLTVGLNQWNAQATGVSAQPIYNLVITGSLLTIIPIVVAFLGLQRFWQSGLSAGSVKG